MVHREAFINKIRELGYTYKSQQKRTQLYRKKGGTHRVFMPLADLLEDDFVKCSLRQAGLAPKDIESFLACAKS
jgi:hypothetical protein